MSEVDVEEVSGVIKHDIWWVSVANAHDIRGYTVRGTAAHKRLRQSRHRCLFANLLVILAYFLEITIYFQRIRKAQDIYCWYNLHGICHSRTRVRYFLQPIFDGLYLQNAACKCKALAICQCWVWICASELAVSAILAAPRILWPGGVTIFVIVEAFGTTWGCDLQTARSYYFDVKMTNIGRQSQSGTTLLKHGPDKPRACRARCR